MKGPYIFNLDQQLLGALRIILPNLLKLHPPYDRKNVFERALECRSENAAEKYLRGGQDYVVIALCEIKKPNVLSRCINIACD